MKYEEKSLKAAAKITAATLSESGALSKESAISAAKFFKDLYRVTAAVENSENFCKPAFKAAGKITAAAFEEAEDPCGKAAGDFFLTVYEGIFALTEEEDFDKDLFKYCGKITAAACEEMEEPTAEKAEEAIEFFGALYSALKTGCPEGQFVTRETEAGHSFKLLGSLGNSLGISEVYTSAAGMEKGIASVKKNAPIAEVEDQTAENPEKKKNPKFEIFEDKAGFYRFRLKAANGEIILAGTGVYTEKDCCEAAVEAVRRCSEAEVTEEE